jgi:cell division protein FtsI/penicillin-binding protein 2
VAVAVVLDQPTPIFGGVVAAPVFREVASYALTRLRVPASVPAHRQR